MRILFLISFIIISSIVEGQTSNGRNMQFNYNLILNSKPIINIYDGLVSCNFIHKINLIYLKEKENKSKRLFGLSYSYFNGSSFFEGQIYDGLNGNYLNYSRLHKQVLHHFNFHYGYQFKPFNKKESFYLEIFAEPGIVSYKSIFEYNPEKIYLGLSNSVYKNPFFSFYGGVKLSNNIITTEKIRLNVNYGFVYQLVSTKQEKINAFAGVGVGF